MVAETYVTLTEAAELEGVGYDNIQKKARRDQYKTRTEKSPTGGRDTVLIAVSSLSKQARMAYREREKLKVLAKLTEDEEQAVSERPWFVECDPDWYMNNYPDNYNKALDLRGIIENFRQYSGTNKTEYTEEYSRKYLGKGQRTLYKFLKLYNEAAAWQSKIMKEEGINLEYIRTLALARKPKEKGAFPSISPEVKQAIKNIWFNADFAANLGTREMCYDKLTKLAAINAGMKIPSYQTVTRYINYLMEDERMANAHYMASNGMRDYKNKKMVKGSRDTKALKVMQIVQGDEHTFDCWVAFKQPNGKITAIKPKLVAWVDTRSRLIMGDVICKDPNSDILKQSLLKMILSDPGGVPEYLYIDNGKDYTAKTMTGRDRNDRSGAELAFDDEVRGFYKSIGIKDDHRALPYEPWSKGQIERFFGGVCNRFTKWFTSYTGTLTGSQTEFKRQKDIDKMLERGELFTLEEFYERWHEWLTTVYYNKEHSGLKKAGEDYKTPLACFEKEERYFKAAPPKSYLTMLMLKSSDVRVYNTGIRMFGYEYRGEGLWDYVGDHVDVKYDPDDVSTLYVFDKKGRRICEAVSQELLQIAPKVPQKALETHIRNQKKQIKIDRERLEEARVPFETLVEGYVGFDQTAGGIELMAGKVPKKKRDNVVQMPVDRTYQQGFRKNDPDDDNEYLTNKAEEVLQKLRNAN